MRRHKLRARGPVAAIAALIAAALAYWTTQEQPPKGVPAQAIVTEVVDGDTLHIRAEGAKLTVRLIGVDTPELHESDKLERDARRTGQDKRTIQVLGSRARDFTRQLCEGKTCRLEYDPANAAAGHRDKYGRLLAYVFVPAEGGREAFVNEEILREGYGAAMTTYPFDERRKARFLRLQRQARSARRGLWGDWKEPDA